MKKTIIFIFVLLILLIALIFNNEFIQINIMTNLVILRGLVSPSCFWYKISDLFFKDGSGINIYNKLKNKYGDFAKVNIFNTEFYLVTNINYIKIILDNSPNLFNVGTLKKKFFSSFMSKNVGISSGCPWKNRRQINNYALDNEKIHRYSNIYNIFFKNITKLNKKIIDFNVLSTISKKTMCKVIFNADSSEINDDVIKLFYEANNLSAFYNKLKIDNTIFKNYKNTLYYYLNNPRKHSLVNLCLQITKNKEEIYHQIPHFIFPILGLFITSIPRLLCLLCNHLDIFQKILIEISSNDLYNLKYLRQCILETLRLNNPVISLFRTLEKDIRFDKNNKFKKGTEFLILTNPILRNKEYFKTPNRFIPERWDKKMEDNYYSMSFSQGPQKCPGKEIAIFLIQCFVFNLIKNNNINIDNFKCNKKLDIKNIEQVINPCDIIFTIN